MGEWSSVCLAACGLLHAPPVLCLSCHDWLLPAVIFSRALEVQHAQGHGGGSPGNSQVGRLEPVAMKLVQNTAKVMHEVSALKGGARPAEPSPASSCHQLHGCLLNQNETAPHDRDQVSPWFVLSSIGGMARIATMLCVITPFFDKCSVSFGCILAVLECLAVYCAYLPWHGSDDASVVPQHRPGVKNNAKMYINPPWDSFTVNHTVPSVLSQ